MPSVGGTELLILLTIVLLFFGAKRIPDLARSLGKGTREFRKGISEGASEDEMQENGKEKDEEEPSLDGVVVEKMPQSSSGICGITPSTTSGSSKAKAS